VSILQTLARELLTVRPAEGRSAYVLRAGIRISFARLFLTSSGA
jgi:hypothetical protein